MEVGTEVWVSGKMLTDFGLEPHEITEHSVDFTEVIEDGTKCIELEVVLGD